MEIGVLGLTFKSGNKGCEALAYSFFELLNTIAIKRKEKIRVNLLLIFPTRLWIKNKCSIEKVKQTYFPKKVYSNLSFDCLFYIYKNQKIIFLNSIKNCKCVFDYTAGDSFTDIYGQDRFYSRTRCKKKVIDSGVPLVLGSQTIGPFNDEKVKEMAIEVIRLSKEVYARDNMSAEYTQKISGREPKLTSDIAFALPYEKLQIKGGQKEKIGFNPSGLLWNGGYTQNNQFGLTVEYKEYCRKVIGELLKNYEVHLIPHAFSNDMSSMDNDMIAVNALHKEIPETKVAPQYITPMEVKSYIAGMDVFIGARMHATIGAFSAGVPVIPFSYSRKFEGLFDSLNYHYVIHGKGDNTREAIEKTLQYVQMADLLKADMSDGAIKTKQSVEYIEYEIERLLFEE